MVFPEMMGTRVLDGIGGRVWKVSDVFGTFWWLNGHFPFLCLAKQLIGLSVGFSSGVLRKGKEKK
jgi:hypothetical protein